MWKLTNKRLNPKIVIAPILWAIAKQFYKNASTYRLMASIEFACTSKPWHVRVKNSSDKNNWRPVENNFWTIDAHDQAGEKQMVIGPPFRSDEHNS